MAGHFPGGEPRDRAAAADTPTRGRGTTGGRRRDVEIRHLPPDADGSRVAGASPLGRVPDASPAAHDGTPTVAATGPAPRPASRRDPGRPEPDDA